MARMASPPAMTHCPTQSMLMRTIRSGLQTSTPKPSSILTRIQKSSAASQATKRTPTFARWQDVKAKHGAEKPEQTGSCVSSLMKQKQHHPDLQRIAEKRAFNRAPFSFKRKMPSGLCWHWFHAEYPRDPATRLLYPARHQIQPEHHSPQSPDGME